jgi:hypothetical protein
MIGTQLRSALHTTLRQTVRQKEQTEFLSATSAPLSIHPGMTGTYTCQQLLLLPTIPTTHQFLALHSF